MRHLAKANQTSAALHNRRITIQLLRQYGPLSRRQLAQITGLRTSTLTYIVRDLMNQNIVRTVGKAESKTVGKKQILLEINPDLGWAVGVGLETEPALLVYVDASGSVIGKDEFSVQGDLRTFPQALQAAIDAWASANQKPADTFMGLGVGVPGVVDNERGCILRSGWFQAQDMSLRDTLSEYFDAAVLVDNDANFAALSESRVGSATGLDHFIFFMINADPKDEAYTIRGMGTSLFLNGAIYRGSHYAAGELNRFHEQDRIIRLSPDQHRAIAEADAPIDDTIRELAGQLGHIVTGIVDLLDPQAVVLGGNLVIHNQLMIQEIERQMNRVLLKVPNREVHIHRTELADQGVGIGAAIASLDAALMGDDAAAAAREHELAVREALG